MSNRINKEGFALVIGIVVAIVIAIALIIIITGSGEDATDPTPDPVTGQPEQPPTEPEQPAPPEQPPTTGPEQPVPPETPDPEPGQLPDNWDELSGSERIGLNPFNCDLESQWMYSDGSCHDKEGVTPDPVSGDIFPFQYVDDSMELICEYNYYQNHQGTPYCSVQFRVVLLTTIDIDSIYSEARKRAADRDYRPSPSAIPSFLSSVSGLNFAEEQCLNLKDAFVTPSVGTYHPTRLGCRDGGLPAVMRQGDEASVRVSVGMHDGMSVSLKTNPEMVVHNLRIKTVRHQPASVSTPYVVLYESLNNSCVNYDRAQGGICGVHANVAIKEAPVESEIRKIALKFVEKYGPGEDVRLTVLRHNGSDNVEDYQVYAIGYGPLFNSNNICGTYRTTNAGGGWIPTTTGKCQQASLPIRDGFFATPQPGRRTEVQAPFRYVEDSLKVACNPNELAFCQIEFEVVLLEDIDAQRGRENRYTLPDFIRPGDWVYRDDCMVIWSPGFLTLSDGNSVDRFLKFACQDDIQVVIDTLPKNTKYKVQGSANISAGATIDFKTMPEVTLTNIEIDLSGDNF